MTHEEIRARLYAAQGDMSATAADCMLNSTDPLERYSTVAANARADRLLAAHLEITKPLRDAAEELAEALESAVLCSTRHQRASRQSQPIAP